MARMRSIKPEMFRSATVTSWPRDVRWTFAGLLTYLDDDGRGLDDVRLIKAEIYPIDDSMSTRKISRHMDLISGNGPLCRYEVDGRRYLHVTSWREHQRINRPTRSRIPPCPVHEPPKPESSVNGHGRLTEPSNNPQAVESEGSLPRAQARVPAEHGSRDLGSKGAGDARERGEAEERASEPPPPNCPKHINDPAPGPCGACGDARRARQRWDAEQDAAKALLAEQLAAARANPVLRCEHGTDGGSFRRPDTGELLCAVCRTAEQRAPA